MWSIWDSNISKYAALSYNNKWVAVLTDEDSVIGCSKTKLASDVTATWLAHQKDKVLGAKWTITGDSHHLCTGSCDSLQLCAYAGNNLNTEAHFYKTDMKAPFPVTVLFWSSTLTTLFIWTPLVPVQPWPVAAYCTLLCKPAPLPMLQHSLCISEV